MSQTKIGGTAYFNSPERNLSFKSDIWSLGVTLYYMATLKVPFEGRDEEEIKKNISEKAPVELDRTYSPSLNKLIMRMLTKDHLKRPSAVECKLLIPNEILEKYEKPKKGFEEILFKMFLAAFDLPQDFLDLPLLMKSEFNDVYSVISDFPNFQEREFKCLKCHKIPLIKINYNKFEAFSSCEEGHLLKMNILDFYRNFTDERNSIKPDVCTFCQRVNEFHPEITYKYCENCKKVLCRNCENEHKTNFPNHLLCNGLINHFSFCVKHKQNFTNYCEECFLNFCNECLIEHNKKNIGHNIHQIELIDKKIIKKAYENIQKIKESIINYERIIKTNKPRRINIILMKLNLVKLYLLYKFTLLKMYEANNHNYIIIRNFLDNNLEIQEIKFDINEAGNVLRDIFIPFFNKSISCYEKKEEIKLSKEIKNVFIIQENYLVFNENYLLILKNLSNLKDLNYNQIWKLDIDIVYKLKNGKFLIGHSNQLKLYYCDKNENNSFIFNLEFEFPKFSQNNITDIIELSNGKIIIISEGVITAFKPTKDNYEIYKNNFHLSEKVISIIEFDNKRFITTSEIKEEEKYCHLEVWDSESFTIIYNSFKRYQFPKNKYNIIKINQDLIALIIDQSFVIDLKDSFLLYDVNKNTYSVEKNFSTYLKLFKSGEGCFIGVTKINDKYCLEQKEIFSREKSYQINNIGFKYVCSNEITNVIMSGNEMIITEKEGYLLTFQS